MTPTKGLHVPERKGAPVDDPAVVAGKEAEAAHAAWLAMPHATPEDEQTPEFEAATERWHKADQDFADAPIASYAGMLVKLRALLKEVVDDDLASTVVGHVKTVTTFLEGFAGEAQTDPLIALWAERNRLVALGNAADTDPEVDALCDKISPIEHQIANTEARTLAGVIVQIKLREDIIGYHHWNLGAAWTRNVIAALERMAGAS